MAYRVFQFVIVQASFRKETEAQMGQKNGPFQSERLLSPDLS